MDIVSLTHLPKNKTCMTSAQGQNLGSSIYRGLLRSSEGWGAHCDEEAREDDGGGREEDVGEDDSGAATLEGRLRGGAIRDGGRGGREAALAAADDDGARSDANELQ